jgi:hypothetical protein
MSYPLNYPTPQSANVQIFSQGNSTSDWTKPQGASFVWFTLIGAGGGGRRDTTGGGGGGGGSGAVTNFMGPAFLMPDQLTVVVGGGGGANTAGGNSAVIYQQTTNTGYVLLRANGGNVAGGTVSANTAFGSIGLYQCVGGQDGNTPAQGAVTASDTTFLSGGAGAPNTTTPNYGYPTIQSGPNGTTTNGGGGQFFMQPIIVSSGGGGGSNSGSGIGGNGGQGGVGSGGGGAGASSVPNQSTPGRGGDGLVVIITW